MLRRTGDEGEKPAILCLHGAGTNAQVFNIQTIRIQRVLQSEFEFVFIDAPFISAAGPDVLSVFDGFDPYYKWARLAEEITPKETQDRVREAIAARTRTGKGFVGVLGFSQGTRVAAGLLIEQQQQRKGEQNGEGISNTTDFRFGVFLNGTIPALTSSPLSSMADAIITIPSLHVIGLRDPWNEYSRRLLSTHFDKAHSKLLEFDLEHRLPILQEDTAKIADEIRALYLATKD